MRSVAQLQTMVEAGGLGPEQCLRVGEDILIHWLIAHDRKPTRDSKEGFRLLALQRQGSKGDPSFNACRETCRELAYHYNLVTLEPGHKETGARLSMANMLAKHLVLFVGGKLEVAELGEFCCSSKGLRLKSDTESRLGA